jgi:hypothetical protein
MLNIFNVINNVADRCAEQDEKGDETQKKIETYRSGESEAVVAVKAESCFPDDFQESVPFNSIKKFLLQVVQSTFPFHYCPKQTAGRAGFSTYAHAAKAPPL